MPTVVISRGFRDTAVDPGRGLPARITGGSVDAGQGGHPKAIMTVPGVATIVLPMAPESVKLTGQASEFASLDRPGRRPLLYKTAQPLQALSFECSLRAENDPMGQKVIEQTLINPIRNIVRNGSNVFFFANLGLTEYADGNGWRCESATITPTRRQHGTNQITRATMAFTFLENNVAYATAAVGPLTGR